MTRKIPHQQITLLHLSLEAFPKNSILATAIPTSRMNSFHDCLERDDHLKKQQEYAEMVVKD